MKYRCAIAAATFAAALTLAASSACAGPTLTPAHDAHGYRSGDIVAAGPAALTRAQEPPGARRSAFGYEVRLAAAAQAGERADDAGGGVKPNETGPATASGEMPESGPGAPDLRDPNAFTWIAVFALGAMVVNALGILAIYRHREWAEKVKAYFMCFAAGVLVSTPLVLALPQAARKNHYAGFVALAGFLFMFFSNKIIKHRTKQSELAFGITAAEGIGIHSIVDGVIYTVTFSVSLLTGFLAGLGLVVHEFAEGVITFSVLLKGNVEKRRAATYAFFISSLTTPLGAFVAYPLIRTVSQTTLALMLGFVAGVLLYVSASHLLPEAREHEKAHSTWAFLAGVAVALFIVFTRGH